MSALPFQAPVPVTPINANELQQHHFERLRLGVDEDTPYIGLSAAYGKRRQIRYLAMCSSTSCLIIKLEGSTSQRLRGLLQPALIDPDIKYVALDTDLLAAALYLDLNMRIAHCVHVQAIWSDLTYEKAQSRMYEHFNQSLASVHNVYQSNQLHQLLDDDVKSPNQTSGLQIRAWSAMAIQLGTPSDVSKKLRASFWIDTQSLTTEVCSFVSSAIREADMLKSHKPSMTQHHITSAVPNKKGDLEVESARYKTRLQNSGPFQTTKVVVGDLMINSHTKMAKGKTAVVVTKGSKAQFAGKVITSIVTLGREKATINERQTSEVLLAALTTSNPPKPSVLTSNPLITAIFPRLTGSTISFGSVEALRTAPLSATDLSSSLPPYVTLQLNTSQKNAVGSLCLSNSSPSEPFVQLVHGPPGTGKTTMITAMAQWITSARMENKRKNVYIVAQSNVAVKNVAEKLFKHNIDFRLLVSEGFHLEWHEHLYEGIARKVVPLGDFPKTPLEIGRLLGECKIILCTLSMITNPQLSQAGLTTQVLPPQVIIADEASQIPILTFLPTFKIFKSTIDRVCFVGDHRQLAPYGQDQIPDMKSVFEIPHLVQRAFFLDTQYRMPTPIGEFASKHMYEGKLASIHSVSKVSKCLRFIDISHGNESKARGGSSVNAREQEAAVRVAAQFQKQGKTFRIITGYDAQRQAIENALKAANLKWEDIVFNVDSFQGNESDYIIISLTRTSTPGFLADARRSNVMLTRCKRGMVILAKREFLTKNKKAQATLVGKLAKELGAQWMTSGQLLNGEKVL